MDIECFLLVVINELLDERRNKIVGHFSSSICENARGINVFCHRMNPHPRHFVHSCEFVLVVWLMLMEDNRQIECIINLTGCCWLNNRELVWNCSIVHILNMPSVRECLCSIIGRRILFWEGGPNISFVLPLRVNHHVE